MSAPSRISGEALKTVLYVDQGLERESSTIFDFSGGLNRRERGRNRRRRVSL